MDMSHNYWEDNANIQQIKYESANSKEEHNHLQLKDEGSTNIYSCYNGNLNFSTAVCSEDDSEYGGGSFKKNKASRQDPMSHRIIEKRRRDRMNNCLADLSRLIPAEYLKKGRGRIEKTEIIEMAIKHMKYLQQLHTTPAEHYRLGYQECMSETMRFLVEVEGHFPREAICVRLLNHLQKHCDSLSRVPPPTVKVKSPPDFEVNNQIEEHQNVEPKLLIEEPNSTKCDSRTRAVRNGTAISEVENSTVPNGCLSETETYDKHSENSNGVVSYKYKTDIKHRFNLEFNGAIFKRQRLNSSYEIRRSSLASVESQSSPPSSDTSARISNDTDTSTPLQTPSGETNNYPRQSNLKSESTNHSSSMKNDLLLSPYHPLHIPENPMLHCNGRNNAELKNNFNVPVFVLNAKGSFYVPITIDYFTLLPFLQNFNLLDGFTNLSNMVLHPVTINVNFQPNSNGSQKYKSWH